ncbi:unnamed protein product, partial [Symbiodinium sp. CCMP2456]
NLGVDWTSFWESARAEMWGQNHHAVRTVDDESRKKAVPIGVHGDEGQGKKAIRSANMAWSQCGVNLTLEALQSELVKSLTKLAFPETAGLDGHSLHYIVGKGGWKHKSSWLSETRDYANLREIPRAGASFCRRCACGTGPSGQHWLDFQHLSFNVPGSVEATLDSNVPQSLLRQLPSWHMDMEAADVLHTVWLGCARDSIASVLMDIVSFDPRFSGEATYDNSLASLLTMFHDWCREKKIDGSAIDELSLSKLHIDALNFDYPIAGSKAYGNKLLCCWAAHFLSDACTCSAKERICASETSKL